MLPDCAQARITKSWQEVTDHDAGMPMLTAEAPADAAAATDRASWLACLEAIAEDGGYLEPLGARHWAFFHDDSPTLLMTFETVETIRARLPGQMPFGWTLAKARGWSHLCLIADGMTWWRDPAVWGYVDRLVDDAFFEDFDRVCLYGAGAGGYAAAAFSVAAPGAAVLALAPRATLEPAVAGWDGRDRAARRLDFTSRYGFAPDMTEGAGRVFVVFDPAEPLDAMHAALYRRPWMVPLPARRIGPDPETALAQMGALTPLVEAAVEDRLTPVLWARLWRGRRDHAPWLRAMQAVLAQGPSRRREGVFCRAALARLNIRRLRRRLTEIEAALAAEGVGLPPTRG